MRRCCMGELDLTRAQWRKSSYSSANGACVEVRSARGRRGTRLQGPEGPKLLISSAEWRTFLGRLTGRNSLASRRTPDCLGAAGQPFRRS